MLDDSAPAAVSGRLLVQRRLSGGDSIGDVAGKSTFPGGWRGHCVSLQSELGYDSRERRRRGIWYQCRLGAGSCRRLGSAYWVLCEE